VFFFFRFVFCRVVSVPSSFRVRLFPSCVVCLPSFRPMPSFLQLQLLPSSTCFPSEFFLSSFLPAFVYLPSSLSLYSAFHPLNSFFFSSCVRFPAFLRLPLFCLPSSESFFFFHLSTLDRLLFTPALLCLVKTLPSYIFLPSNDPLPLLLSFMEFSLRSLCLLPFILLPSSIPP
jgi:hypothetical protein